MVDAVQPGGAGQDRGFAPHYAGDRAIAFPVPGGQDRAPRRRCAGAVQRSLRGARNDGAVDGSTARDCAGWQSVRACAGVGASALSLHVHKILCTAGSGVRMTYPVATLSAETLRLAVFETTQPKRRARLWLMLRPA